MLMNPFIKFMVSPAGRIVRALAGVALIAWGLLGLGGTTGAIVAIIGLVPLLAGVLDFCLFSPLFGYPFSGKQARAGK
jgi:hypothetical protein